jgi:hypothetical protein
MSTNSNTNYTGKYSKVNAMKDNGPQWGSYVGKDSDGTFNFDREMQKTRPNEWYQMVQERLPSRTYKSYPKKKRTS